MSDLFARYKVSITMNDKIMGGVPRDPGVIEGWIRSRMGLDQGDQLRRMVGQTLLDMGVEITADPTPDELEAALKTTIGTKSVNGFKRDDQGLFIEGRQIKAALKENTAILFPYVEAKWGATRKAPRAYLAERLFVEQDRVPLGRQEPDGIETFIGHVSGPQGPRSTLTYVEFCQQPELAFTFWSVEDSIKHADLDRILKLMEQNGIGALRSQGHGRFTVTNVEPVKAAHRPSLFAWEEPKLKVVGPTKAESAAD